MQTRPYPEKDGLRVWLALDEQRRLLEAVDDDDPRREIALQLGLHGLRTDEIVTVEPQHVRPLANGADGYVLVIPDGKTGKRETPISSDLEQRIDYLARAARLRQDDAIVDISKRSIRNWIDAAREDVLEDVDEDDLAAGWRELGMHDLRRTWATNCYYALAFEGVPIAEQLTMSWGGWKQSQTGRETFRRNYLGPVPDHITERAVEHLALL